MLDTYNTRWARWLASQGLPSGHIARVLELDQADVDEVLARRPFSRGITIETEEMIRRLARECRTYRQIGDELGIHPSTVYDIVNRSPVSPPATPPPHRGGNGILGPAGSKVRILDEMGYDPGRIAAILTIRRADVVDFLDRTRPLRTPKNGTADLVRPRGRAEHKRAMATLRRRERRRPPPPEPDEWGGYRDNAARALDDQAGAVEVLDGPVEPAIAAAELPRVEALERDQAAAELPATSADEWTMPGWRGEHNPRSMLDFDLAEEIRAEWARGGITQRELALKWCISRATLKRVLSRQSYAAPPAAPPPVEPEPPATSKRPPRQPRARATVCRDWDYRDTSPRDDPAEPVEVPAPAAALVVELEPLERDQAAAELSSVMTDEWPHPNGARPILDHAAHALVVELRAAGWSWSAIGRRLGVRYDVAQRAAARVERINDPR